MKKRWAEWGLVMLFLTCSGISYDTEAPPGRANFGTDKLSLAPVALVYSTCNLHRSGRNKFSFWRSPVPAYETACNPKTNRFDCNEAVPYLNFIIKHYHAPVAKKLIFVHGHDTSWHCPTDILTAVERLLATNYFADNSYGGLYKNYYAEQPWSSKSGWGANMYRYVFANTSMSPEPILEGTQWPCCATFWVNSEQVRKRPLSDYITMKERLQEWSRRNENMHKGPAYYCGRVMEYNWHVLLGRVDTVDVCRECLGNPAFTWRLKFKASRNARWRKHT